MTDLEMTKLCAEAMGIAVVCESSGSGVYVKTPPRPCQEGYDVYDPLHYDAQAMALVKKFRLELFYEQEHPEEPWHCFQHQSTGHVMAADVDINRAIVECVAKMQEATVGRGSRTILPPPAAPSTAR